MTFASAHPIRRCSVQASFRRQPDSRAGSRCLAAVQPGSSHLLEHRMSLPAILEGRLSVPVVASPLFIISNPDLVIAQCKAGVVGFFPALNARPLSALDEWLDRITTELA